jgi:hypothetical protein
MLTLPIKKHLKQQERKTILNIAQNNGFPMHRKTDKKQKQLTTTTQQNRKWVSFTYHSPLIRKVTKLFKQTNQNIALRATNTTHQLLTEQPTNINPSGIYKLKCKTCSNTYIGQSGESIKIRHKENMRYIRTNNPTLAYALNILNNRHEYGTPTETLELLKPFNKDTRINRCETLYIQAFHQRNTLINEQQVSDINPLYELTDKSRILLRTT